MRSFPTHAFDAISLFSDIVSTLHMSVLNAEPFDFIPAVERASGSKKEQAQTSAMSFPFATCITARDGRRWMCAFGRVLNLPRGHLRGEIILIPLSSKVGAPREQTMAEIVRALTSPDNDGHTLLLVDSDSRVVSNQRHGQCAQLQSAVYGHLRAQEVGVARDDALESDYRYTRAGAPVIINAIRMILGLPPA